MRRFVLTALVLLSLLTLLLPSAPAALAQGGLTLVTRFPAQQVAKGEDINFPLILRASTPQVARLSIRDLPDGWTATLRGDGRVIEAAYILPDEDTRVDLRVEPADNVAPGEYRLSVLAEGNGESATLQLQITVKEQLPPSLVFDVDLPSVRGAPDSTFRFNTTLRNEGDTDLTANLIAEAPSGWFVRFRAAGQEVTSLPVRANGSESISVEVEAPEGVELGSFPIYIKAESGDVRAEVTLTAEVVGQPQVNLTTPDGRLSGQATIGQTATYTLLVRNTGAAPARNITLSGTPPSGWTVEFQPATIAELGAGAEQEVTVSVRPADKAVAGDYVVSFSARPEEGRSSSIDYRITVLTSTLWGIVGIVLIAIAVGVVGLAVSRFGRR
ncbi:MAG: NEW3 domain-containing protein [Oscillochloridaceae bacterium]|nr:NEW3 domain-containing protein [Chloroflexaceae bacterium]MDW8390824.1 NEW3 domain-containing protein [Oscillochloridaceae bacterium]